MKREDGLSPLARKLSYGYALPFLAGLYLSWSDSFNRAEWRRVSLMTERGKQTPGSPFLMVAASIHSQRHTLYLRDWPRVDVIQLDGEEWWRNSATSSLTLKVSPLFIFRVMPGMSTWPLRSIQSKRVQLSKITNRSSIEQTLPNRLEWG